MFLISFLKYQGWKEADSQKLKASSFSNFFKKIGSWKLEAERARKPKADRRTQMFWPPIGFPHYADKLKNSVCGYVLGVL